MMHQKSPPPDIRQWRPDAPDDLLEICRRMMAKKAAARYQSAQEVADALADWLRAHGHSFDSSILSAGSSGRLPRMTPETGKASGDTSSTRRLSSGVRAALLAATAESGVIGIGPAGKSPTGPAATRAHRLSAKEGSGAKRRQARESDSARRLEAGSALHVAKPLEESDNPLAELLSEITSSGAFPRDPRQSASSASPVHRGRRPSTPPWIWALIAAGCAFALFLIFLAVLLAL
jgi:hypothetical protein